VQITNFKISGFVRPMKGSWMHFFYLSSKFEADKKEITRTSSFTIWVFHFISKE
jgi:hypothetical protein